MGLGAAHRSLPMRRNPDGANFLETPGGRLTSDNVTPSVRVVTSSNEAKPSVRMSELEHVV